MATSCQVKAQLLLAYQKASESYSKTVSQLAHDIEHLEYELMRAETERSRRACVAAREALDAHTSQHSC